MQRRDPHTGPRHVAEHKIDQAVGGIGASGRAAEVKGAAAGEGLDEHVVAPHDGEAGLEGVLAEQERQVVGEVPDLAAVGVPGSRGAEPGEAKSGTTLCDGKIGRTPFERVASQRQLIGEAKLG